MILFRADGNKTIGTGHIMRCLSIAQAAVQEEVIFITSDQSMSVIIQSQFKNIILNTSYTDLSQELEQMQKLIRDCYPSVLFIDSYFVTESYLEVLKKYCAEAGSKLVYIDDLLSFPYPCDILINYNIYALDSIEQYQKLYSNHLPKLLLGPSFVPLRKEFYAAETRRVKKDAYDILISTGGADLNHIALQVAQYILSHQLGKYRFHIILGEMNLDKQEIKSLIADFTQESPVILHENVNQMSQLMLSCDVAVSAAGFTLYELCAMQTPTITYILADNQIPGAETFERHGILKCAGDYRIAGDRLIEKMIDSAIQLAEDDEERKGITEKMRTMIAGNGAQKILKDILNSETLRGNTLK